MNSLYSMRKANIALATLAVLILARPASAQHPVPFRGWAKITVTGKQDVPPSTQILTGSAIGESTHLGLFTRTETVILDLNTFQFTAKKMVFTAANGDLLYADAVGTFVTLSGTYTITGGTGRFINASGSAVFSVTPIPGGFALAFDGKINY